MLLGKDGKKVLKYHKYLMNYTFPRLQPGWLTPVRPFSLKMWLGVLISLTISILMSYIVDKINRVPNANIENETFVVIRYLLLQPPHDANSVRYNRYEIKCILTYFGNLL